MVFGGLLKYLAKGQLRRLGPALARLAEMAYSEGYADGKAGRPFDASRLLQEVEGGVEKGVKEAEQK